MKNPRSFPQVFHVCAHKPDSVTICMTDDYLSGTMITHGLERLFPISQKLHGTRSCMDVRI